MNDTTSGGLARRLLASSAGLLVGAAAGAAFVLGAVPAGADRLSQAAQPSIDATHLPPLLTTANEAVELRYDIHCVSADESATDEPCAAGGKVFIRAGDTGPYSELPLRLDAAAAEGRYVARVPSKLARSPRGFTYYAVLSGGAGGPTSTLPAGGADAPQRSLPLGRPVEVRLGAHAFGAVRSADSRVAEARWGDGPADVGLEDGRNISPAGGSSFDVDAAGNVFVLDHVHRRILSWSSGARTPRAVPVSVDGTIADLAVSPGGAMYVLEGARAGRAPAVRSFSRGGVPQRVVELAERTASQVRIGPIGPVVLQHPSGQWVPVFRGSTPLSAAAQEMGARAGRTLPGGSELVVLRWANEIRAAIVNGSVVTQSWRITSATPLAEVQLAEPLGTGLALVVRVYTDAQDEFRVLVLGPHGLVGTASLDSADWAETAPLSRFRLVGASLYQLGSTSAGLFVDRFDLEVR
jgi:hypothetical protein